MVKQVASVEPNKACHKNRVQLQCKAVQYLENREIGVAKSRIKMFPLHPLAQLELQILCPWHKYSLMTLDQNDGNICAGMSAQATNQLMQGHANYL